MSRYTKDAKYHYDEFLRIHSANPKNAAELKGHYWKLCGARDRAAKSKNDKNDVYTIDPMIEEIRPLVAEVEAMDEGRLAAYFDLKFERVKRIFPIRSRKIWLGGLLSEISMANQEELADKREEIKAEYEKYEDK